MSGCHVKIIQNMNVNPDQCLLFLLQVKAALKTVVPAEQKYIEEEQKVSKQVRFSSNRRFERDGRRNDEVTVVFCRPPQLLRQNFNRVKRCIVVLINYGTYMNSCFKWESAQRSIISFVVSHAHTGLHKTLVRASSRI